jgi:hypothetical protein
MAFRDKWRNKNLLAIAILTITVAGPLIYLMASPVANILSPKSISSEVISNAPSNPPEAEKQVANIAPANKPIANLTKKESANATAEYTTKEESIIAKNTKESILYIRVMTPFSGKGLGGIQVNVIPINSTANLIGPLPGVSVALSCNVRKVPNGSAIQPNGDVILPNGTKLTFPPCPSKPVKYVTNDTGWVIIDPVANAKYYLIDIGHVGQVGIYMGGTTTIPVNQIKVVTFRVAYEPEALRFVLHLSRETNGTSWYPSNITAKLGKRVVIDIINDDLPEGVPIPGKPQIMHRFVLPAFNISFGDIPPRFGGPVEFTANKLGVFKFYCDRPDEVVNGVLVKHSEEVGWLTVEP